MALKQNQAATCLDFLEAVYGWNVPDETWLSRAVSAAWELWERPRWACGLFYDASDINRFSYSNLVFVKAPPKVPALFEAILAGLPPPFVAATYRSISAGFGKPISRGKEPGWDVLAENGIRDIFGINGLDPSGVGCFIGLATERSAATPEQVELSQRLAAHLAAGYRARRRLEEPGQNVLESSEAILDPDGHILEARGPAKPNAARAGLESATRIMQAARRHPGPQLPTQKWRPRVQARWTLLDSYSRDGERYIVARENQVVSSGLNALTEREQQVVIGAALGKSNKVIAYDLGVSHSTVRVLIARACARLGVTARKDLLEHPSIRVLRGEDLAVAS